MDKTKVDKLFFGSSKIILNDEDIINRPHGFISPNEDVVKEIQKLRETIEDNQRDLSEGETEEDIPIPHKIETRLIQKELNRIKKIVKLGNKEKKMLKFLSDLKPHSLTSLTRDINTKDCKHLKKKLQEKIKKYKFMIHTDKATGHEKNSYYQLKYLPTSTI